MKKLFFVIIGVVIMTQSFSSDAQAYTWWDFQAIDTMKYSRDPSREFLENRERLDRVAEEQVRQIAETGATHVGIATPYDAEFLPVLKVWVEAARRHNLKVWFRGNWSGWENWFGYEDISRDEHLKQSVAFVKRNAWLFENGDVFSACPECENGGPGDPRMNGDADGHKAFLIAEHRALSQAFKELGLDVDTRFNSMNGDVARLIMDKETTAALGGLVVVDHYVRTPEQLNRDITAYAQQSGGQVVLGEWGAPIPDIHGQMNEEAQAVWIESALTLLSANPNLSGLSYWTNQGGSTAIWSDQGRAKLAVASLTKFYRPQILDIRISNELGKSLPATLDGELIKVTHQETEDHYQLTFLDPEQIVKVTAPGYQAQQFTLSQLQQQPSIELTPTQPGWLYRLLLFFKKFGK